MHVWFQNLDFFILKVKKKYGRNVLVNTSVVV